MRDTKILNLSFKLKSLQRKIIITSLSEIHNKFCDKLKMAILFVCHISKLLTQICSFTILNMIRTHEMNEIKLLTPSNKNVALPWWVPYETDRHGAPRPIL